MADQIEHLRRELRAEIASEFERQRHRAFVRNAQITMVAAQVVFWAVLAVVVAERT